MLGCRPYPGWDSSQPSPSPSLSSPASSPSLLSSSLSWGGPSEPKRQKLSLSHLTSLSPSSLSAGAKRQHPVLVGGPSARSALQQKENMDFSQRSHSPAKQQKLDSGSLSLFSPACSSLLSSSSSSSWMAATPGGGGLLPSPRPGLLPFPIPPQGSRGPGFAGQPAFISPASSSQGADIDATNLSLSSVTSASCEGDDAFPDNSEMPAQVEIDRIYSELESLNKRMNALKWSVAPEVLSSDRGRQIAEVREEMNRLHKQLAKEKQRLHKENMDLNQKLAMQYNLSMASQPSMSSSSSLPHTERKENHNKAKGKKKNKSESTLDDASSFSVKYSNLSIQIFDLDCKIEALEEGLTEGEDNHHTLQVLCGQRKALKRERNFVKRSKNKLLQQEKEALFGLDPFRQLKKLAKRVRTWRILRSDCSVLDQSLTTEGDDDVQIVDDSDASDGESGTLQGKGICQNGRREGESKQGGVDKTVRDIEECMTRHRLTSAGHTSYVMLSALSSILLTRQKQRRAATASSSAKAAAAASQLSSTVPSSTTEPPPCPLSNLTRDLAQKLDLSVGMNGGLKHGEMANLYKRSRVSAIDSAGAQSTSAQDTANMYMQIFTQQK